MTSEQNNAKLKRANLILGGGCVTFLIGIIAIVIAGMSYFQDKEANKSSDIAQGTEIALFKQIVTLQSNTDTTGPAATANAQEIETLLKTQVALEENRNESSSGSENPVVKTNSSDQFFDDFSGKLSSDWEVITGTPVIIDGRLGSAEDQLNVSIADTFRNPFTIDLDYWFMDYAGNRLIFIIDESFIITIAYNYSKWEAFIDNEWVEIAEGKGVGTSGHAQLAVEETTYKLFINGNKHTELTYGEKIEGNIKFILNDDATYIDNIKVYTQE